MRAPAVRLQQTPSIIGPDAKAPLRENSLFGYPASIAKSKGRAAASRPAFVLIESNRYGVSIFSAEVIQPGGHTPAQRYPRTAAADLKERPRSEDPVRAGKETSHPCPENFWMRRVWRGRRARTAETGRIRTLNNRGLRGRFAPEASVVCSAAKCAVNRKSGNPAPEI